MKRRNLMNQILIGAGVMLAMTLAYAGTPLWTFTPLTATTVNVTANGTATVKYQVTNQSRKSHSLVMTAIPGITQVTTAGNCPNPFSLAYQQSCTLTLSVNGSSLSGDVVGGPMVCQQGNSLQCYQPSLANSLNITQSKISNHTVGGTITGLTETVTLLNNGTNPTSISTDGNFTFSTPIAEGSAYAVTIQTPPAAQTCGVSNGSGTISGSNVTNVEVTCTTQNTTPNTTISVSQTGTIPVDGSTSCAPAPAPLTVTNTGAYTAFNVSASLPGGWTGVTQNATNCTSIAPGGTCTLNFTSTTPYIAQGNISITGDNITSPPTTALAFTMDCYLVWAVSGSTAQVIQTSDVTDSPINWSQDYTNIPGISETSTTADGDACNGATDGNCNTGQIEANYGVPYANYAAGLCYGITSDNSGTVSAGTWYLPAICQMGSSGGSAGCSSGLANIDTNLVQLGFGGLAGTYWSSTEFSLNNPQLSSWAEYFSTGTSFQSGGDKDVQLGVRCSRALTL